MTVSKMSHNGWPGLATEGGVAWAVLAPVLFYDPIFPYLFDLLKRNTYFLPPL